MTEKQAGAYTKLLSIIKGLRSAGAGAVNHVAEVGGTLAGVGRSGQTVADTIKQPWQHLKSLKELYSRGVIGRQVAMEAAPRELGAAGVQLAALGGGGAMLADGLSKQSSAYIEGFLEKCAALGIDPLEAVKQADGYNIMDNYRQIGKEVGGIDPNLSGLQKWRERFKRGRIALQYAPTGGFFTSKYDWQARMNELKNQAQTHQNFIKGQLNPTPTYYQKWMKRYQDYGAPSTGSLAGVAPAAPMQ